MRRYLSRNPELIIALIACYYLLAILVRVVRSPGLEVDESQAALSQFFLWGYGSQPPLFDWLQLGLAKIIGMSIATLSILKNSVLFLSCLFMWLTARLLTGDRFLSGAAALGVLTLPPIFLMAQRDLTHSLLAVLAVALFLYTFFRTLQRPSLGNYLLAGLAVGIGTLSKYNFVIIPLAAILAVLPERELRARVLDWRMLVAVAVSIVIVLPHGLWVLHNMGLATGQTMGEMTEGHETMSFHGLFGALDLIMAALKGSAVTLAVFAALFYRDIRRILPASNQWTRITGRILLLSLLIVLVIVFALDVTNVRQKWLIVYLVLLPLYITLKIHAAGVEVAPKLPGLVAVTSALTIGVLIILLFRGLVAPYFGRTSLVHIPYDGFAQAVRRDGFPEPRYVVAPSGIVGGNLKIQFPKATVYIGNPSTDETPSRWEAGATVLIVGTDLEGQMPQNPGAALAAMASSAALPAPGEIRHLEVPYAASRGEKRHAFYYAWTVTGAK